jgi:hypothetical protein
VADAVTQLSYQLEEAIFGLASQGVEVGAIIELVEDAVEKVKTDPILRADLGLE